MRTEQSVEPGVVAHGGAPSGRLPEQNVSPSGRSLHATRGKFRPRPPDHAARVALVKPFVLLATRPEDAAADSEYKAMLRFGAQAAEPQHRLVLAVGCGVLRPGGQQHERFHERDPSGVVGRARTELPARRMQGTAGWGHILLR